MKEAGKYNIEMVFQPILKQNPIVFYLMDKKGKPVSNKDITAEVKILRGFKVTETLPLSTVGENGFTGQLKDRTGPFICELTLKIKGKETMASFDSEETNKKGQSGY